MEHRIRFTPGRRTTPKGTDGANQRCYQARKGLGRIYGEGDLQWNARGDRQYGGGAYAYYLNLAPIN